VTRVLIDTNGLLRMAAGGRRSQIAQLWSANRFELIMSLATLTELRHVLAQPDVQRYVDPTKSDQLLRLIEQRATFVQPDLSAPQCRDPQDTALIATAVGGQANFLVTADTDLLDDPDLSAKLAALGIQVIMARDFIEVLKT
jgi:hypothetical protein